MGEAPGPKRARVESGLAFAAKRRDGLEAEARIVDSKA